MARPLVVVADTSPLNYLVLLGCPDILPELYGRVLVPLAVIRELQHSNTPGKVRDWTSHPPSWLEVTSVGFMDSTLSGKLGAGEREAIGLAIERKADAILIDDALGRSEAKARNLIVNGTLFVVLEAALRGRLEFESAISRLRESGFRFSVAVEDHMRSRYKQGKRQ